jgi:hypothetical protein
LLRLKPHPGKIHTFQDKTPDYKELPPLAYGQTRRLIGN